MRKNNKKINKKSLQKSIEDIWQSDKNDPNGSYVGNALDGEHPVQDADDL